ncbi:MAG: hypothetical protein ACI85I_002169 [Arenicella sp.]|jgi:hypothetical protein
MTIQEFDTALYDKLYDFFVEHEFEMNAPKKQFRRLTNNGFQNVLFSTSEYEGEIWLEVNLGVRINAVEQIVQQFLDNQKGFREDAMTVIVSVGKLTNNKYFRYKVVNEDDLESVCLAVKEFMRTQGFQFLNVYNKIESLDSLLNKNPHKPTHYLYNQVHRCFKGAVLARLNFNPKFEQIILKYHHFLATLNAKQTHLERFDKLETFLTHYSPN